MAAPTAVEAFQEEQVVVLRVQGGDYAVPIGRVQEIVQVPDITRVPDVPASVEGVINLRGHVLPVVDLAKRLVLGEVTPSRAARVVVVESDHGGVGLLVDGVSEVWRLNGAEVEPPSEIVTGTGRERQAVRGVAKFGERLVLMLDLDAALAL